MGWVYLSCAVAASITANVFFKILMASRTITIATFVTLVFEPPFWIAIASCGVLFCAYLLALSSLPVAVAYTALTVTAMLGINIVDAVFFHQQMGLLKLTGTVFAISGVGLIVLDTVLKE